MRLLLADDHVLVRDVLKAYIERAEPEATVLSASSVDEAIALAANDSGLDLIMLDYRMPGMDGFAGFDRMRAAKPGVPVAIISGLATRSEIHQAIARGAAGFLPKTLTPQALLGAIRLILSGERFLPAAFFDPDGEDAGPDAPDAAAEGGAAALLTRREREVLSSLCKGEANKEIARKLELQEVTVKIHVRNICRKLNAKNRTQAVLRAIELGVPI